MSDFDNDTDEEIAEALEKLNIELVKGGKIHAADDAIMIQAYKRLRNKLHKVPTNECDRCHKLDSLFVKTTDGVHDRIYCVDCLVELIDLKKMLELNDKYHFKSFVLK